MLTGQKGKSKVVSDVEVAMAESRDHTIGTKAVTRCPGYKQAGKHLCIMQSLPAQLQALSPDSVLCVL